jgi:hypothetical protein
VSALGRLLCAVGLHSWRDVSRVGQVERVQVCRRGCGARRTTWDEDDV